MRNTEPVKVNGRTFDAIDIDVIRHVIQAVTPALRSQIARDVCRALS